MFIVTLVLISCAILVFFSQEFAAGFKKLFAIPGMKLLLPLTLVTMLIVYYEAWTVWSLLKAREALRNSAIALASSLHFSNAYLLANALMLFALPLLLLMTTQLAAKKNPTRDYQAYYLVIALLWFFALVLLVVDINHPN